MINYVRTQLLYLWKQKDDVVYKYDEADTQNQPQYVTPATITNRKPQKDISSLARKLELQALQKPE